MGSDNSKPMVDEPSANSRCHTLPSAPCLHLVYTDQPCNSTTQGTSKHDFAARSTGIVAARGSVPHLHGSGQQQGRATGQQQGRAKGQQQGRATGQQQGPATGQQQGCTTGQQQGRAKRQQQGRATGQQQGPATGQQQGRTTGQQQGPAKGQQQRRATGQQQGPATGQLYDYAPEQQQGRAAGQLQGPATAAVTSGKLDICDKFQSRAGCSDQGCLRLHMCRQYLVGLCKRGLSCDKSHQLMLDEHNKDIIRRFVNSTTPADVNEAWIAMRQKVSRSTPDSECTAALELCFKYASREGCSLSDCNRIHICLFAVDGVCRYTTRCRFEHSLTTLHNGSVLSRHRATRLSTQAVLDILKLKKLNYNMLNAGKRDVSGTRRAEDDASGAVGGAFAFTGSRSRGKGRHGGRAATKAPSSAVSADAGGLYEDLVCSICLELLERAVTLGCGHSLCELCLQQMRPTSNMCPTCRAPITSANRSIVLDNVVAAMNI